MVLIYINVLIYKSLQYINQYDVIFWRHGIIGKFVEGVIFSLLIRVPRPSFMLKWQLRFNQKNSEIV